MALYQNLDPTLRERIQLMNPLSWKQKREAIFAETQKIYEQKIKNNHLLTSHNLLGYIDMKLNNPNVDQQGEATVDMSQLNHPYEMEQIENLNKVDQAKYLSQNLQKLLDQDSFSDPSEKHIAETNLKCL